MTTSRYYTPSGDSINDRGIAPDVMVESRRQFPDADVSARLDREGDVQLIEAIERLRKHRILQSSAD